MNARSHSFAIANELSPVVYGSVDGSCVTYRLEDGKVFRLNAIEARQVPNPRWAFIEREMNCDALAAVNREEETLYKRMRAEADR